MRPWLSKLVAVWQRRRLDDELDEEIRTHLELATDEYMRQGMSRGDARRAARRSFGGVDQTKERHRDVRTIRWLEDLTRDLSFACRTLIRAPSFTVVAVLTLAIAIGANTAVYSVVEGVLLHPLGYERPDRLVSLYDRSVPESGFDLPKIPLSLPEVLDYRDQSDALGEVGYYQTWGVTIDGTDATPQRVQATVMSHDVLPLLGLGPALGRWFTAEEDLPDGPRAMLLSHAMWRTRFGEDPRVVGRMATIDGMATEIVGVMPEGFGFPNDQAQVYLGMRANEASPGDRGNHGRRAIGRLAEGHTLETASAELSVMMDRWAREDEHHKGHFIFLVDFRDDMVGSVRATLWTLMVAVGLVLLIAASNVANLMMARGETGTREVSIRVAIGAGRGRVVRQFLTESVVIAGAGGLLGLGLARVALQGLIAINPTALPRMDQIGLDRSVLAFTGLTSLGVALLFGLMPALQAGRRAVMSGMRGARTTDGPARARLHRGIIATEVALSVVVVLSASVVVRSFETLTSVDSGMNTEGLLTFSLALPDATYRTPEASLAFFDQLLDRLRSVPGVDHASFLHMLPIPLGGRYTAFTIEGRAPQAQGELSRSAFHYVVSADYLATAGVGLLGGRTFSALDGAGTEIVGLISETAARQFWPGEDPIGQRIGYGRPTADAGLPDAADSASATIVGVVGDIKVVGLEYDTYPQVYVLQSQTGRLWGGGYSSGTVMVRATATPEAIVGFVRQIVAQLDSTLPLADIRTMSDIIDTSVARPRLIANLLASFAVIALVLAAVGVYGVVSCSVARRTREIGIRVALGASSAGVVRRMAREGAAPALLGIVLGVMVAVMAATVVPTESDARRVAQFDRTMGVEGLLFEDGGTDPVAFTAVPLMLLGVALVASWIPARRALQVSPTEALRGE